MTKIFSFLLVMETYLGARAPETRAAIVPMLRASVRKCTQRLTTVPDQVDETLSDVTVLLFGHQWH